MSHSFQLLGLHELIELDGATIRGTSRLRLSNESKNWLQSLAKIKLSIDQAAIDIMENSSVLYAEGGANLLNSRLAKHSDDYIAWLRDYNETNSKAHPFTDDEALAFVTKSNSIWIWRVIYLSLSELVAYTDRDLFYQVKAKSAIFIHLGSQLSATAGSFDVSDLSKILDVLAIVQTQLGVLDCFSFLYHRAWNVDEDRRSASDYGWVQLLRDQIRYAKKDVESRRNSMIRSPIQHHQDNMILQLAVAITILGCIYPLIRAMTSSPPKSGLTGETDFWQQLINSIIQLNGFLTLLLPIYRETAAKEWVGTWIITSLGCGSAIVAVPLYLMVPTSWSVFFTWLAAASQLFVVLQVALVAAFQSQNHAKKE